MSHGKHVKHTHEEKKGTAWCGAHLFQWDWTFQDVDHIAYHIMQQGGVPWCKRCVNAIIENLKKGV